MANEEHLAILKQGVDTSNQWREENPDILPDLREAGLLKVNLREADLEEADLRYTDFRGAATDRTIFVNVAIRWALRQ